MDGKEVEEICGLISIFMPGDDSEQQYEYIESDADTDFTRFVNMLHAREMHSFGLGDGMYRRQPDRSYIDNSDYTRGYCIGMTLPSAADHDEWIERA